MNKCCRVCLIKEVKIEFLHLTEKIFKEKTVLEIIRDCAPIEVLHDDPLPQEICIKCSEKLKLFYGLRQLILKSDQILKTRLVENKELSCNNDILQEKELIINNKTSFEKLADYNQPGNANAENRNKVNLMIQNEEIKKELLEFKYSSDIDEKTENLNIIDNKDNLKTFVYDTENHNELCREHKEHKNKKGLKKPSKKLKMIHECKECNKIFKKADHYTVHMTKHTGEKKYACEFCPKRFARSYVLVYHRRLHTGERPYTCDICSKSFSSPSNFYAHKKIHTGERNYKCDMCDESFIQSDSLKIHIRRIHTGERPFLCEICSSAFRSNSSLLTHKLDMHGKKEPCPICSKPYSSRVLKEHIRRHKEREQGIKRFVCDQCGKMFTCSSSRKKTFTYP